MTLTSVFMEIRAYDTVSYTVVLAIRGYNL